MKTERRDEGIVVTMTSKEAVALHDDLYTNMNNEESTDELVRQLERELDDEDLMGEDDDEDEDEDDEEEISS